MLKHSLVEWKVLVILLSVLFVVSLKAEAAVQRGSDNHGIGMGVAVEERIIQAQEIMGVKL